MFGNVKRPIKPEMQPRPIPKIVDVIGINMVGHMAPEPNSRYEHKMKEYKDRQRQFEAAKELACLNNLHNERTIVKYSSHFEKTAFARTLNERVNRKMMEYEEQIEIRRAKLRKLLYEEERVFIREVVDSAQSASRQLLQDRLRSVACIKEQREAERLETVRQNKLRQDLDRCVEFRPVLANRRLRETKQTQLEQMKENEARKACERELAEMWHEMVLKEMKAQLDREEAEAAKKQRVKEELRGINTLYLKELDEQNVQRKHEISVEKKLLDKLKKEIELEDSAAHQAKLAKRNEICRSINSQVKQRQETLRRQADNEQAIANTFRKLVDEQVAKERLQRDQKKVRGQQDMVLYQQYLEELRQSELQEQARMEEIVQRSMREIQQKQTEEKCNFESARKALLEKVLKERAEQVEYQRKLKNQQQALKQEEAKWCTEIRRVNEQLSKEKDRERQLAMLKYTEELRQQIEYSKVCKKRSQQDLEATLSSAAMEEKLYNDIVSRAKERDIQMGEVHPFLQVLNQRRQCHCPK